MCILRAAPRNLLLLSSYYNLSIASEIHGLYELNRKNQYQSLTRIGKLLKVRPRQNFAHVCNAF